MHKILVIDDDEIMLKVISNILGNNGFEVFTATTARDISAMLSETHFEIVITDLMLPHINGLEVVGSIRMDDANRNTGIIVISSIDTSDTAIEAFRLGADDFITKPIIAGELLMRVNKLIENKNNKAPFVTKKK